MGRKKIEIKPLTDERNRNVTFLKRKAGLMKKAWELSVLCQADVSIVIFAPTGKCYEFTSVDDGKGLDGQLARYVEYEGSIERRRAPEFAAAAAQGDDDSGDDEAPSTKKPAQGSLKGKEEHKERTILPTVASSSKRPTKRPASDSISRSRSRSPPRHYSHPDGRHYNQGYGNGYPSSHSHPHSIPTAPPIRTTADPSTSASIQYALSMNGNAPQPSLNSLYPSYPSGSLDSEPAWDSATLARLAEFQLQQDHQRQQRALLERQRRQLIDLGVPANGDPAFMEMIFGNGNGNGPQRHDPFVWPTSNPGPPPGPQRNDSQPQSHHAQPAFYGRHHSTTPFTFPNRPYGEPEQAQGPPQAQAQDYAWEGQQQHSQNGGDGQTPGQEGSVKGE